MVNVFMSGLRLYKATIRALEFGLADLQESMTGGNGGVYLKKGLLLDTYTSWARITFHSIQSFGLH